MISGSFKDIFFEERGILHPFFYLWTEFNFLEVQKHIISNKITSDIVSDCVSSIAWQCKMVHYFDNHMWVILFSRDFAAGHLRAQHFVPADRKRTMGFETRFFFSCLVEYFYFVWGRNKKGLILRLIILSLFKLSEKMVHTKTKIQNLFIIITSQRDSQKSWRTSL